MRVRRGISVAAAMLAVGAVALVTAAPVQAAVLERTFGPSGGYSMFDHTCVPRPGNTVWAELRGNPAGNDNHVAEVRYKNFSGATLRIYSAVVGANGNHVYLPPRELGPFGEVIYGVHRTFPGKMTILADQTAPDFAIENCGGRGGNKHVFSRP